MIAQSLKTKLIALILKLLFLVIPTLPLFAQDIAPFVTPKIDPSNFRQLKTTTQQQGKQIQVDKVAELQKALETVSAELEALKTHNQGQDKVASEFLRLSQLRETQFQEQLREQNRQMQRLQEKIRKLSKQPALALPAQEPKPFPKKNTSAKTPKPPTPTPANPPSSALISKKSSPPTKPAKSKNFDRPIEIVTARDKILITFHCPTCGANCELYFHSRTGKYCLHKTRLDRSGIGTTTTREVLQIASPTFQSMQRIATSLDGQTTLYRSSYGNQYFVHRNP